VSVARQVERVGSCSGTYCELYRITCSNTFSSCSCAFLSLSNVTVKWHTFHVHTLNCASNSNNFTSHSVFKSGRKIRISSNRHFQDDTKRKF
jgi:hypothetical protein